MGIHYIHFCGGIRKIFIWILLSGVMYNCRHLLECPPRQVFMYCTHCTFFFFFFFFVGLGAQLDVPPTGDQEVVGLIPHGVGNILSWRFDHEIFSAVIPLH